MTTPQEVFDDPDYQRAKLALSPYWLARVVQLEENFRRGKSLAAIPWPDEPPVVEAARLRLPLRKILERRGGG